MIVEAGPFAVDFFALPFAAHYEHAVGVAVIGTAIPVFFGGAAELAHGDDDDILHAVAHILMKRGQRLTEVFQQIGELALHAAFVDVIVPAAAIDEENFHADFGFQELADLLHVLSQAAGGILRAIFRRQFAGIDFAEHVDGFEGFGAGAVERVVDALRIHGFEAALDDVIHGRGLG